MKRSVGELSSLMHLLDEALELPESERLSWVEALPDTYDELRPALRLMLGAKRETSDFTRLEGHIGNVARTQEPVGIELAPGTRVGAYQLEKLVGQGGMGTVWLAHRADGAYQRQVALKLPHVTWMGEMAGRLARERDILASLQHDNIARFFDAGLDEAGRPFLAMEFVAGKPIDEYCREQGLSVRARLDLILAVADAVAHAHSKLVVHRDLKPSNILVTPEGSVRLLDFGVASLLDAGGVNRTQLTQFAGRALTIDYASPEQIRGETIGTASDVYSLAVVTFELLTGSKPYRLKRGTPAELEQAIAEVDLRPASEAAGDATLKRELRGDLDAILNKAMKKDPAERYPTVAAFGEDLARHLNRLPVQARPDSALYRARKFIARHSLQVSAAALILLAVLAGSGVALWQAHLARAEAVRADQIKEFVLSIFEAADSDSGADRKTTALELLQAAQQRILKEFADQPRAQVELLNAVGFSLLGLDETDAAEAPLKEAYRIGRDRLGETDPATLRAGVSLAEDLGTLNQNAEADSILRAAIPPLRQLHDPLTLGRALRLRAVTDVQAGKFEEAADLAAESERATLARGSGVDDRELCETYYTLAVALRSALRPGALDAARRAYDYAQRSYPVPTARGVLNARMLYNNLLLDEGDLQQAKHELKEVLARYREAAGDKQTGDMAMALTALGRAQAATGEKQAALDSFRTSMDIIAAQTHQKVSRSTGIQNYLIGQVLLDQRDFAGGERALATASSDLSSSIGADQLETRTARSAHALALARVGRFSEADAEFAALTGKPSGSPREAANIQSRFGIARLLEKRYADAQELLQNAVTFFDGDLRANASKLALAASLEALAETQIAQNRETEARSSLDRAVELWRAMQPDGSPELSAALELRATLANRPGG